MPSLTSTLHRASRSSLYVLSIYAR